MSQVKNSSARGIFLLEHAGLSSKSSRALILDGGVTPSIGYDVIVLQDVSKSPC